MMFFIKKTKGLYNEIIDSFKESSKNVIKFEHETI
jgi:hypothetical protein